MTTSYDFKTLSHIDFENLSRDLLQEELGITLESFKQGKDQGIDLRCSREARNELIVQSKHYLGSSYSKLISDLKKEVLKVERLSPKRYIVVTSQGLTPFNKTEIKEIFGNYIQNENDIYGCDDLNNLLGKYPKIQENHYKLWMTSTSVLNRILHNDLHVQSKIKLEQIKDKIKLFVPNPSMDSALAALNLNNYVVISGNPGVGKTTLADMLIWQYLTKGFEFINISEDVNEGFKLLSEDASQVFYFDDFLGQTTLNSFLNKNEDDRLIDFIKHIKKSPNKRFILTTREYILKQAKLDYEKLSEFHFEECVIDLKEYTTKIKGEILYYHLYFSELPSEYKDKIIEGESYFDLIKHENYNPRIIEYMTKKSRQTEVTPDGYLGLFLENLNNPSTIWKHSFNNQLKVGAKSVLLALLGAGNCHSLWFDNIEEYLKKLSENISKIIYGENLNLDEYRNALKILDGDFMKSTQYYCDFANPSIRDFLEAYLRKERLIIKYIESSISAEQLQWIFNTYLIKNPNEKELMQVFYKLTDISFLKEFSKTSLVGTLSLTIKIVLTLNNKNLITQMKPLLDFILEKDVNITSMDNIFIEFSKDLFCEDQLILNFLNNVKANFIEELEGSSYSNFESFTILYSHFKDLVSNDELIMIQEELENQLDYFVEEVLADDSEIEDLESRLDDFYGTTDFYDIDISPLQLLEEDIEDKKRIKAEAQAQEELDEINAHMLASYHSANATNPEIEKHFLSPHKYDLPEYKSQKSESISPFKDYVHPDDDLRNMFDAL